MTEAANVGHFDIETDGLNPSVIHQITIIDGTGQVFSYNHETGNFRKGLQHLERMQVLIGHNIISYDLPVLRKMYPEFTFEPEVVQDTLVLARLAWPHISDTDYRRKEMPKQLIGSHSLKAWGLRLGFPKYDYGETTEDPWAKWSPEMEKYCLRDVEVVVRLFKELEKEQLPSSASYLEHEIHALMDGATRRGWAFDRQSADKLYVRLIAERDQLEAKCQELFPPKEVQLKTKTKLVPFNPGSRMQIAERFQAQGWKPKDFTPEGRPKISETILEAMEAKYPEAETLKRYLLVQKRLGQLAEGKNSWLGLVEDDDRIHGKFITCGATVSHRMTHHSPNLSQCPNLGSEFGKEMRSLFGVSPGFKLVGSDLSGAELRLLAHAMSYWDDGKFAKVCEEGDPHQENADRLKIGRSQAKVVQFALIYGAGDQMLGEAVGGGRREGAEIRFKFYKTHPAFQKCVEMMQQRAKDNRYLVGLDGRKLYPRSQHSVLNLWIQNATVTVAKYAALAHRDAMLSHGLADQLDFGFLGHFHDEWQVEVVENHAELVASLANPAIEDAGKYYGLNVKLSGDTSIGDNWSETH